jgi:hypothetical protein
LIYLERLLKGSRSFFIRLVAGHSFFMMTKQEKIALQQENPTNALAFKEGFFYPATARLYRVAITNINTPLPHDCIVWP